MKCYLNGEYNSRGCGALTYFDFKAFYRGEKYEEDEEVLEG